MLPGFILNLAKKRGWKTFGIEPSAGMAENCNNQGHKVLNCQIDGACFDNEKFDIITLWDVIEHLRAPVDDFIKINSFLNVDGHVCLWTKNIDSLRSVIMGRHYPFIAEQHIVYYSPVTLTTLFEKTGFKLVKLYRPPLKMTFNRVIKRLGYNFPFKVLGDISIPITFYDNMLVFAKKIRNP